jgi:D-alanine-D-alanine ligase
MDKPLAVIFESSVDAECPQVEIDELRENTEEIGAALQANGYATKIIPFTFDVEAIRGELLALKPAFVFNLVDSIDGKGDLVQIAPLLLEHMGIPFTGNGSMATTTSCHKVIAKQLMRGEAIPTAEWLTGKQIPSCTQIDSPYILKSATEHASFGLFADCIVRDAAALRERWRDKKTKYGTEWFAERYIEGREFNISVLQTKQGPRVLPFAEIVFTDDFPKDAPRIVDYAAKWFEESRECKGTVRRFDFPASDQALLAELGRLSLACWDAFRLAGYARVDFRIDAQGKPFVVDVNANPFLTANEGFGAAAAHAGLSFPQVIGAIVEAALKSASLPRSMAA